MSVFVATLAALLLGLVITVSATPQPVDPKEVQPLNPDFVAQLKLKTPAVKASVDPALLNDGAGAPNRRANVDPALLDRSADMHEMIVKLKSPPVVQYSNINRRRLHKRRLQDEQSAFLERNGMSAKEIARVQTLMNAVFLKIDASEVATLAADPDVISIHGVGHYEMHLSETVSHVGAFTVQNQGYDGNGIRVAILDSGIDYTHIAFGGEGTIRAFQEAYLNNTSRDGLFPTPKVVEGYDFLGESWPAGDIAPDDDPIDGQGHGTAVADIVNSVAPGVSLYAVRVCARLAMQCNGVALMQGIEYAVDPDGDGDTSDAVDVINLSIGTPYGTPFDHDLSQVINAASDLGVLVVASAGNAGDKPYSVATSSSARSALCVAQTEMPSASLQLLRVAAVDYRAVYMPWSPSLDAVISAPVIYGDGNGRNLNGCTDFSSMSISGKIVLVDRGECNFSLKINKISEGGGLAGIVGLIASGDPFTAGDGGDSPVNVPGFMISQADADDIRAAGANTIATLDPNNRRSLALTMAPSSSRGPQHEDTSLIKPEIGAPGASIAAVAGTGIVTAPFGGTSGASPVVTGSAALILSKHPSLKPHEVKARLMNNGETNIRTDPYSDLAPITRIGGGEVRVDRALSARVAAWDDVTLQAALSFGFVDVFRERHIIFKMIRIRNYSKEDITFSFTPIFRFPEQDNGSVTIRTTYSQHMVRAESDTLVTVILTIFGNLLPNNYMSSGEEGGSGDSLTKSEFDGFLVLDDGVQPIHLPWHVLPRKAANVTVETNGLDFILSNNGVGTAQIDPFSLLAVSENIPEGGLGKGQPTPDIHAVGIRTRTDVDITGVCNDTNSFVWEFAISSWERQEHLAPVAFKIFLDINQDGTDDYLILNNDISGQPVAVDGRQVVYVLNLDVTNFSIDYSSGFYVDHGTNTGNVILAVCAEQIGMSENDLQSTSVNMEVYTEDIMYNGGGDNVTGLVVVPGGERYVASTQDLGFGETAIITVTDKKAFDGNSEELGVMLFTNADRGVGNRGGATEESEVLLLRV